MIRRSFFSLLLTICLFSARSQQTPEKFVQETNYLLYLPEGYAADTTTKWPMMLFLHGSGESGHDLNKVKVHGPPKLVEQGKKFPFIIVSPQAPDPRTGWQEFTLHGLIGRIKEKYRVDPDRVYLTGLSMGGFGTWKLAMKYPQEFAAIVPICGGGDTADLWKLRNMPVWCFHGALDDVVPPARSKEMVEALRRYNPSVRFTLYPDANHNSWTVTYENDSLYKWLLAQKRFTFKRIAADPAVLRTYAGKYVSTAKDTVQLFVAGDSLKVRTNRFTIELQPAERGLFFIKENEPGYLEFIREKNGKVSSFMFYDGERMLFRKYE